MYTRTFVEAAAPPPDPARNELPVPFPILLVVVVGGGYHTNVKYQEVALTVPSPIYQSRGRRDARPRYKTRGNLIPTCCRREPLTKESRSPLDLGCGDVVVVFLTAQVKNIFTRPKITFLQSQHEKDGYLVFG